MEVSVKKMDVFDSLKSWRNDSEGSSTANSERTTDQNKDLKPET